MEEFQRRDALRIIAVAAALPAVGLPSIGKAQLARGNFAPPAASMQFSRSLIRELVGGAQIVVMRT